MQRSVENELLGVIRRLDKRSGEQDVVIAELKASLAAKDKRIAELEATVAKLRKNSSTSSKPPSSDIVKPAAKGAGKGKRKRKRGGQPGHAKHDRPAFPPEEIDRSHEYTLRGCPCCGGSVRLLDDEPRVVQQVELETRPVRIEEHRGLVYWCERCQTKRTAPLPTVVERAGLLGPRLTALVAYLKCSCHASFSTIRKYLRDVVGLTVSRGYLRNVIEKVSKALESAYAEILQQLPLEERVNVDETGHKDNGARYWTWCFRAEAFTFFKIAGSRGSDVLFEILGHEFGGVLGCDYFSAYRKYMREVGVLVQFCLAHLIRDVRYLTTLRSPATVAYGERLLRGLRALFRIFHDHQSEPSEKLRKRLDRQCARILAMAVEDVPAAKEARNMAKRFLDHGREYFQFVTTPGIDPTNNIVEQAIRFVVIDRLVTQGTRSERGRLSCERLWTVMATCAQKGRSAFQFILDTVEAYFADRATPSLLHLEPALVRSG